jgi:hypothetical protein
VVRKELCNRIVPGEFTILPENIQEHVDKCDECWDFLRDMVLLVGQLSRGHNIAAQEFDAALAGPASSQAPTEEVYSRVSLSPDARSSNMAAEVFNDGGPQLPTVIEGTSVERAGVHLLAIPDAQGQIPPRTPLRPILIAATLGGAVVAIAAAVFIWGTTRPIELPRHAALAEAAGKAFDAGEYEMVVELTQDCIDGFEPAADRIQMEQEAKGRVLPSGSVSDEVRDELLALGPLNDVAVCYFYLGQAHRKLGHFEEARQAYQAATTYSHARVWDPRQKIFWPPANDAAYWLKKISEN